MPLRKFGWKVIDCQKLLFAKLGWKIMIDGWNGDYKEFKLGVIWHPDNSRLEKWYTIVLLPFKQPFLFDANKGGSNDH